MSAVTTTQAITALNVAMIIGTLIREPRTKVMKTGETVVNLDIRVKPDDGPSTVVPISWIDNSDAVLDFLPGDTLVIKGQVRQTWYGPASNWTDVLADEVVKLGRPSKTRKLMTSALAELQEATP